MKELEFQTLIVNAVKARGGFAMKMSNRFLVGVPDLLVKLPTMNTMVLEAKFDRAAKTTSRYTLSVTPKQASTLRRMAAAGMVAGVVSLLQIGKLYGFKAVSIGDFEGESDLRLDGLTYTWCERKLLSEVVVSDLTHFPVVESYPCPSLPVPSRSTHPTAAASRLPPETADRR